MCFVCCTQYIANYTFFVHLGRIGNQVEHFLGGMAFAAATNRTLVLPPFRTYVCI